MLDLSDLSRRAERIKTLRESKKWWKWILAALLGVGVTFALAALLRKLNPRSGELAQLRTELEQRKVDAEQREHAAKVHGHTQKAAELKRQAVLLRSEVVLLEQQYLAEEAQYVNTLAEINQIKDWAGLDQYNRNRR